MLIPNHIHLWQSKPHWQSKLCYRNISIITIILHSKKSSKTPLTRFSKAVQYNCGWVEETLSTFAKLFQIYINILIIYNIILINIIYYI